MRTVAQSNLIHIPTASHTLRSLRQHFHPHILAWIASSQASQTHIGRLPLGAVHRDSLHLGWERRATGGHALLNERKKAPERVYFVLPLRSAIMLEFCKAVTVFPDTLQVEAGSSEFCAAQVKSVANQLYFWWSKHTGGGCPRAERTVRSFTRGRGSDRSTSAAGTQSTARHCRLQDTHLVFPSLSSVNARPV